jgi:hypothetical protein
LAAPRAQSTILQVFYTFVPPKADRKAALEMAYDFIANLPAQEYPLKSTTSSPAS